MNFTFNCETVLAPRFALSSYQRTFLITYEILINGLANLVLNSLVIATLVKTKQYRSPAMRIMLYMSISDVCLSIITPYVGVMLLTKYKDRQNCLLEITGQFLCHFLGDFSALNIGLLAFDRYARIAYLQEYKTKMSKRRINLLTLLAICLSLAIASFITLGTVLKMYKVFALLVFSIGGTVVFALGLINFMAMKTLNRHCTEMHSKRLEDIRVNIVSLTKAILFTVIVFYTIYLGLNLLHLFAYDRAKSFYWRGLLEFWLLFGLLLGLTNSVVNALLFIKFNKESHKLIRDIFCYRRKLKINTGNQENISQSQQMDTRNVQVTVY